MDALRVQCVFLNIICAPAYIFVHVCAAAAADEDDDDARSRYAVRPRMSLGGRRVSNVAMGLLTSLN